MKVENQPQQKKEHSINLHLLLKGLHREFPEKDRKLNNEATDSGSQGRKKKKKRRKKILNVFDENVASCMFDTIFVLLI